MSRINENAANSMDLSLDQLSRRCASWADSKKISASDRAVWREMELRLDKIRTLARSMMSERDLAETQ